MQLKGRKPTDPDRRPIAKRGRIRGFTRRSRGRLMQLLASVDLRALEQLPLFWTGTYPGEYPEDPKRWKRDLTTFLQRLERKYPEAAIVWRMEPQARGAPHFHMLIFGVDFIPKAWIAKAWYESVGSGDERHLRMGSRIERIETWRGVLSYASKYLAKVGEEERRYSAGEYVGRHWGVRRADNLPTDTHAVELAEIDFHRVRRAMRQLAKHKGRGWYCRGRYAGGWMFASDDTQLKLVVLSGHDPPPA